MWRPLRRAVLINAILWLAAWFLIAYYDLWAYLP